MPYWNVLTNVAIAKIAKYVPSTLNDLRLISEVPPSQARKYSDKIFECVDMFVERFERELREKRRVEESKRVHHGHRVVHVLSDVDVSCEQPFVDNLAEIFDRLCPVREEEEEEE